VSIREIIASSRLLVIAHRGNSRYAPENSLASFRAALSTGADLVELDYWHSADGRPVVIHDDALDRTTNAIATFTGEKIPVASRTLAELMELDAGSWFGPQFASERLPSLEQALEMIHERSFTMIERKGGDAQTLVSLLESRGWLERVIVHAFDWRFLDDCRRLAPDLALGALGKETLTEGMLDDVRPFRPQVVCWRAKDTGKREIDLIHRAGMKAWVYTVDETAEAKRLIDAGIDGLISNDPALIHSCRLTVASC
jgi:glycerophosphoryl diester phosphodiesterase